MKISNETLSVLASFSRINQSIYINEGDNFLSTISIDKNIMGKTEIVETFPSEFGIYDLSEFLSAASLIADPDFEFGDTSVVIKNNSTKIKFSYVSKELVISPPSTMKFPDPDITINISNEELTSAIKAAAVLSVPSLIITNQDGKIVIAVDDHKNSSANTWSKSIGDYDGENDFTFIISVDNLKMMPGDYAVDVSSKGISRWTNAETVYYIALSLDSTFA
jgi:hypothetical protein